MADYYTHFSVTLPIPKNPELAARIPEWVSAMTDMADCMQGAIGEIWDYEDMEAEGLYGCLFSSVNGNDQHEVWVYSDGEGNADAAVALIQRYLDDFEIEGGVLMSIAWTCSKPRVNEAGGAAVVITRNDAIWVNAQRAACKAAGEAGVEVLN